MANYYKNKRIKVYYYDEIVQPKPVVPIKTRVYIHGKNGLCAAVRDLSQAEILANSAVDVKISLEIMVNYNPDILKRYNDLWLEFNSNTYILQSKPDAYDYRKGDMKLKVEARIDLDSEIAVELYKGTI